VERWVPLRGARPRVRPVPVGRTGRARRHRQRTQPGQQLLGSLGNCLAVGYAANASVAGIALRGLRIELSGDVDLHAFLGLRGGHAGFDGIRVSVHVDSDAAEEALQELHAKVIGSSPVGHTLSRAIPLEFDLVE
jgi:uncharacterized OsmC-like protein